MGGMKNLIVLLLLTLGLSLAQAAPLKVASLHPLLSEMATEVGGDRIKVVNLFPENGELHAFEPSSAELSAATGARLLLACGKGVEPYLGDLSQSLSRKTRLLELGKELPDVRVPGSEQTDPHWWNNPENMKRASRTLLAALSEVDPGGAEYYSSRQRGYAESMDKLTRMGKLLLNRIPREKRVLVTSHAAMCHFCEAFGFTPIAVHGVARESEGDTASLAALLTQLRQQQVTCLFSEVNEPSKALEVIARELGIDCHPLVMDGIYPRMRTYDRIFMYNVGIILSGLRGKSGSKPQEQATAPQTPPATAPQMPSHS